MALGYLISPAFQYENESGKPLVGGTLRVCHHGTTTPYITYADFQGNRNPEYVPLDSKGMAVVLADDSRVYDVYCWDSEGVQQWSRLNVAVGGGGGGGGGDYSAGYGIEIDGGVIGVDPAVVQEKLTAGTGIDITGDVISVTGAFSQEQADWAQTDPSAVDYIKNKPSIPSALSAGNGIDITNNVVSADFVLSSPHSATSSGTFPAVDNGDYTITSGDLQGGFIYLRLADIRPGDAVQAGIGCTFQVFLNGMRFYRQDPQTAVTVGGRFTCGFEWVLAEIANPSLWSNSNIIEDVEFSWRSQDISTYRSLAFACDDNGANWVTNAPHLAIYLPPELRSDLQVGDTFEILGEIYARPGKDRLSLV